MATAKVDHVSLLEADEEEGVLVRLVRRFRVTGITDTDYDALTTALDASGVPVYDATLTGNDYGNLAVRERTVRMIDRGVADVDVTYLPFENRFDNLQLGTILVEFSGTVQSVPSNVDKDGLQVTTSHTYSSDEEYGDRTITQGGQFNYLQANKVVLARGRKSAARVWIMINAMVGKVNSVPFVGGAAGTYLCTRVSATPADVTGTPVYDFEAEFQNNPDGWDPTVSFVDPRTGLPPDGLVEGTGRKTVERYESASFEAILQARIFGG